MVPYGPGTVAFDAHGVGYFTAIAQGSNVLGYFVLTTTNGVDWGTPQPVVSTDFDTGYYEGNLAIDPRASGLYAGSLYMFWLYTDIHAPNYQVGIRGRYSRDGGRTWSADVQVSDPGNFFSSYPNASVGPDGTVYVAFQELDHNSINDPPKLFLSRSTDGGQTWSSDTLITGAPIVSIGRHDFENIELTLVGSASCSLMRINHYPVIAAAPDNPNIVYATWNDGRWQNSRRTSAAYRLATAILPSAAAPIRASRGPPLHESMTTPRAMGPTTSSQLLASGGMG